MSSPTYILSRAFDALIHDPAKLGREIVFRIRRQLQSHPSVVTHSMNGVNFEFDFAFDYSIERMYFNVYEREIISVLQRYLKAGDSFIDVGANIGYLSAVALGIVGKSGAIHSFEPVPRYFDKLKKIPIANPGYHIHVNQAAAGGVEGSASIAVTNLPNIGWNTMVPGFMPEDTVAQKVAVPVRRLDNYIREHNIKNLTLIKIDTEGYELPTLEGLSGYLQNQRPILVVEVAPGAYKHLGRTLADLDSLLATYRYRLSHVKTPDQYIAATTLTSTTNVLLTPI